MSKVEHDKSKHHNSEEELEKRQKMNSGRSFLFTLRTLRREMQMQPSNCTYKKARGTSFKIKKGGGMTASVDIRSVPDWMNTQLSKKIKVNDMKSEQEQ